MKPGKLIVFEGISGTGKETQAKLLQQFLSQKKITSQIVFHPSPELKLILNNWRELRHIDHITEIYLLLADRYDRMKQIILPLLAKGEWIISLRNYISALVYQGKTASERIWIKKEFLHFEHIPDFLFFFDIKPDGAMKRIMERHEKTGEPLGKFETTEILHEKRQQYLSVLKRERYFLIDAEKSIVDMHRDIKQYLNQYI